LSEQLPIYEEEHQNDYYSHFPKPNFDKNGVPIVPEEFKQYENCHVPREDGTFPWEPQGHSRDIEYKQWKDPPIKSSSDLEKWFATYEGRPTPYELFQMIDFGALKREVEGKFDLEKVKQQYKNLKTDPQSTEKDDVFFANYWESFVNNFKQSGYDVQELKQEVPGQGMNTEIFVQKKHKENSQDINKENIQDINKENIQDINGYGKLKDLVEELDNLNNRNTEKASRNYDEEKMREEWINRWKYGRPYKPTKPLHEEFNFENPDDLIEDEQWVNERMKEKEEKLVKEYEMVRNLMREWSQK